MKITKTTTKDEILEALDTENLRPGAWFRHRRRGYSNFDDCAVCALGAILRKVSFTKIKEIYPPDVAWALVQKNLPRPVIAAGGDIDYIFDVSIANGNYPNALSNVFEGLCLKEDDIEMARLGCMLFVEGYFPEVLEMTYEP